MSSSARSGAAGVTLVEVLVALAITAVVGAAGFGVLDQVLRVQRHTEGRMARLEEIQRAVFVVTLDLRQVSNGSVETAGGDLVFARSGPAGALLVRYRLEDATLVRYVSRDGATAMRQAVISGVETLSWRFWRQGRGWLVDWRQDADALQAGNPAAVELGLVLSPPGLEGVLRRVALLPSEAVK